MSLFALPVTLTDIENLQKGIEFQTNVPEATLEVALINAGTQTVASYANQLLLNMVPLSQVVMAVDSLMSGAVQSEAEMTNLTVNFLPAQLAFFNSLPAATQAGAGGPIVWDAEVTGFALTEKAAFTTNFAKLNTGANAGTAGDAAFAAAVSTSIFGNTSLTSQVLTFLDSFKTFLTNNPTELTGNGIPLSDLVKAADALTFGTEVGIALSNPTTVGATLEAEVTNALIANAEFVNGQGPTPVGVALQLVPPATPLQGTLLPTFTLTVSADTAITGQPFDGTGAVVPASNVVINGFLGGIFGNQATLTSGDDIALSGTNNQLNATFNTGGTATVAGETIKGVQFWNFSNFGTGTVDIKGGVNVGGPGPIGGTLNAGVQTIGYTNSGAGSELDVGTAGAGIQSVLTNINMLFNGGDETVSVYIAAAAFAAAGAPTAITVTVNDGVSDFPIVDAGPDAGTTGYKTFHVVSQGGTGVTNGIELGATLATNATTVTLTDDGANTTLYASDSNSSTVGNWANLTSFDGSTGTGTEVITGAEEGGTFGFLDALTGGGGKFSITLDNAPGNYVDLTAWTATAANLSIALGTGTGNEVDLNSALVDTTTAFAAFSGVATVGDAETAGGVLGGTINMLMFPGASEITLMAADGDTTPVQSANFTVNNAPTTFTFNYQDDSQGAHNTQISSGGSTTATLTVDVGTGGATPSSSGQFAAGGYHTVDLNVAGDAGSAQWTSGILIQSVFGDTPTLAIAQNDTNFLELGNVFPTINGPTGVGHESITVVGGTLLAPTSGDITISGAGDSATTYKGTLFLGITNASMITDTSTGVTLQMDGPTDTFVYSGSPNGVTVTSDAPSHGGINSLSILEGSLGSLTEVTFLATDLSWTGGTSGAAGATSDSLTDLAGTTEFFGVGGGDAIAQGGGGNTDFFGTIELATSSLHAQTITDGVDNAYSGFWGQGNTVGTQSNALITGGATSADMTTISGFQEVTAGAHAHDVLDFNVDAWAGGTAIGFGFGDLSQIVNAGANTFAAAGAATWQLITSQAQLVAPAGNTPVDVVGYGLGNIASAAGLVTALDSLTGSLTLSAGTSISAQTHVLFAYASTGGDIKIADVDFVSGIAAGGSTMGATIAASDMVNLGHTGIDLLGLSIHPEDINFSYHGV